MVAETETIARPEAATAAAMLGQGMDPLPGSSNGTTPHAEPAQSGPEREFADEPTQASLPIAGAPAAIPADDSFDGDYGSGAVIEEIAYALIKEHEGHFAHLRQCQIRYRWKRHGGSRSGAPHFGAAVKAAGLVGHFSRADFVIWLAADHCRTNAVSREALEGLVRHQLLHIQPDPRTGELRVIGHDFEGFFEELTGDVPQPWLAPMVHRAQQLPLMGEEPEAWPVAGDEGDE